ncbi:hypothetical protein I7I51_01135 [Histoplasma capsulatum]|uniref:Uncharacterized protein n=1 Tax=Ajellomyces capsulatus TaxID=5037 RepID=A0A8A1MHC7_AJECA|nr:hypothetical protein I7I51_01135 [Histoplasma capsulatum]
MKVRNTSVRLFDVSGAPQLRNRCACVWLKNSETTDTYRRVRESVHFSALGTMRGRYTQNLRPMVIGYL